MVFGKFGNLVGRRLLLMMLALLLVTMAGKGALAAPKAEEPQLKTVLLLPLDTRPPCHGYVIDGAKIAGVEVISPPHEILDLFRKKSESVPLGEWIYDNMPQADVAVISVDQLFHGGLIASRKSGVKTAAEGQQLKEFFETLHTDFPEVPLYVFSTFPRITPTEEISTSDRWPEYIEYSRLVDQLGQGYDAAKAVRLEELKASLPPDKLERYLDLYDDNEMLQQGLVDLVKKGVIRKLIIGQDDGEEFGIPNVKKRAVRRYAEKLGLTEEDVTTINGADEIGLSMVAKMIAGVHGYSPKVYLEYNDPSTAGLVMPYMAADVETTVKERFKFYGVTEVSNPDEADFTFFVSCVGNDNLATREESAEKIKALVEKGKHPVLIDLSVNFSAGQTVFPFMLRNDTPVANLGAYAGWNTLSNSVGTALSQAIILQAALKDAKTKEEHLGIWQKNLNYLVESFLEDYYYLKEEYEPMNSRLRLLGVENVQAFKDENEHAMANALIDDLMKRDANRLLLSRAFRLPIELVTPQGKFRFAADNIEVSTIYPWPRTFEVGLRAEVSVKEVP